MVRKRLSDMLREEAQKPGETESEPASTDQVADTSSTTQSKPATKRRSTTTGSQTAKTLQSSIASKEVASKEVASKEEATAIALEVTRLKAELEAAVQQADALNQQVSNLQAEVENQTTAAKKIQATAEKAERRSQQLDTELSEAKQTILQLVEVNSQLKQDLTAKQSAIRETFPKEIAPPLKASLPTTPPPAPAEAKKNTLTNLSQRDLLRRQQKSLAHPVFPAGNPPGHLSEQDLGWVD